MRSGSVALIAAMLISVAPGAAGSDASTGGNSETYGTYITLVENAGGSLDEVTAAVGRSIEAAGWEIVVSYDAGVGECDYGARVFLIHAPDYAKDVLAHGTVAAFALPLRMAAFEDENGVHVVAVNPQSINRTIVAEEGFESQSAAIVEAMEAEFPGKVNASEYGQMRSQGLITKTMGVMAGGPFPDKVGEIASVKLEEGSLKDVADRLHRGLEDVADDFGKWEMRPAYRLDLPDNEMAIIGMTGKSMEAKSFEIIGAGPNDARKDFACPGIDHAPAYPIELVIVREDDKAKIYLTDVMFRMKMYFEEAGKMKFAMNMRMPGQIESEIRDKVEESLY
jgi:uncharacterized protein (DUF302 family)